MLLDPEHHTVKFEHPGMRIDLGGIGKGYAVDHGIGILQARGFQHALVTAGGDSRIIGDRMGRPWVVGIRNPDDKNKVVTRIPIVNSAMSTSGDYERYFDEGGVRYHHIIDPRTGHSASKVRSATILGPTATETDGMSKTAFVLGPEKALEIINRMPQYDAIFVTPDGKVLYSNGLAPPSRKRPLRTTGRATSQHDASSVASKAMSRAPSSADYRAVSWLPAASGRTAALSRCELTATWLRRVPSAARRLQPLRASQSCSS